MLQRFYADNFRCLVNFELKPGPVQLLAGGNGSGKSTVFEALDCLRRLVADGKRCEEIFGGKTRTRWQQVATQRFELDVALDRSLYRYVLVVDGNKEDQPRVKSETLALGGKPLFGFVDGLMRLYNDSQLAQPSVEFHADWHQSGLAIVAVRPDNQKLTRFKNWLEQLRPIQINPWSMSERSEREARYLAHDAANLADWYRHLQQENGEAVNAALTDLREVVTGFKALNARKAGTDFREVMATLAGPEGKPVEIGLAELSEGSRCLIALYLLLHTQTGADATLLIDEPDNFIALREIQPWLMRAITLVEDASGQLIVASHHPELLNQLVVRGGLLLSRDGGGSARVMPFPESPLPPAELVARGWENE